MHLSSVFVLWQSRKDADFCGKAARTEAVAATEKRRDSFTLIQSQSFKL
jgi:hypothetical protein